jgi:uncharacterized membrane protein
MLIKIIRARRQYKDTKDAMNDPMGFAMGSMKGALLAQILPGIITLVLFFALLFILSFTGLLGGPYLLAKVIFWILVVPLIISLLTAASLYVRFRGATKQAKSQMHATSRSSDSTIIDVEVED